MLLDKPSGKINGRIKFYGTTPLGHKISGHFFRIFKQNLYIKSGESWHKVNAIYLSHNSEVNRNV